MMQAISRRMTTDANRQRLGVYGAVPMSVGDLDDAPTENMKFAAGEKVVWFCVIILLPYFPSQPPAPPLIRGSTDISCLPTTESLVWVPG